MLAQLNRLRRNANHPAVLYHFLLWGYVLEGNFVSQRNRTLTLDANLLFLIHEHAPYFFSYGNIVCCYAHVVAVIVNQNFLIQVNSTDAVAGFHYVSIASSDSA